MSHRFFLVNEEGRIHDLRENDDEAVARAEIVARAQELVLGDPSRTIRIVQEVAVVVSERVARVVYNA